VDEIDSEPNFPNTAAAVKNPFLTRMNWIFTIEEDWVDSDDDGSEWTIKSAEESIEVAKTAPEKS